MNSLDSKKAAMAARLRMAREQAGLSQGQVARLLKIHRPSISEMEAGRRKVSAAELARFAEIYNVDLNWLSCTDSDSVDQGRVELAARELAKLRPDDLDRVLNLLKTLKREKGE